MNKSQRKSVADAPNYQDAIKITKDKIKTSHKHLGYTKILKWRTNPETSSQDPIDLSIELHRVTDKKHVLGERSTTPGCPQLWIWRNQKHPCTSRSNKRQIIAIVRDVNKDEVPASRMRNQRRRRRKELEIGTKPGLLQQFPMKRTSSHVESSWIAYDVCPCTSSNLMKESGIIITRRNLHNVQMSDI